MIIIFHLVQHSFSVVQQSHFRRSTLVIFRASLPVVCFVVLLAAEAQVTVTCQSYTSDVIHRLTWPPHLHKITSVISVNDN